MGTMDLKQMPPTIKTPIEAAKNGDIIGPIDLMGKICSLKSILSKKAKRNWLKSKKKSKPTLMQEEGKAYVEEIRAKAQVVESGKATVTPTEDKAAEGK